MSLPLPAAPGVRHSHHELATGVRLHFAEAGDAGAPPIIAVHGWPQHLWLWRDVIPVLAEVEVVEGDHLLVDERPELAGDRARTWFG